jgi:DnaJ-class molecular chaperone
VLSTTSHGARRHVLAAKKYHPDVSGSTSDDAMFRAVTDAYKTLMDDRERAIYDQQSSVTPAGGNEGEGKRKKTSADIRRKNEPWRVETAGMYSRADHEAAYQESVWGTMERIKMERRQQAATSRESRERVTVPTQKETMWMLVGRPAVGLLIVLFNVWLATGALRTDIVG